jgi:hypothetical protein
MVNGMCGAEAADTRSTVSFDDVEQLVESVSEFTYVFESTFVLGAEHTQLKVPLAKTSAYLRIYRKSTKQKG